MSSLAGYFGGQGSNPYGDLSEEDQRAIDDYNRSFYAGPNYKGRHETGQFLDSQYANLLRQWAHEPAVDLSGEADIGRYYDNAQKRLSATMAARGIGGSGIEAGGAAGLYGSEGQSVGDYIRSAMAQRQAEHTRQLDQFNQMASGLGIQGLQRNISAQYNKGGFWKDLAGIAGTVGGALIGGPVGAGIGKKVAGLVTGGGGGDAYNNNGYNDYGQRQGSGSGSDYGWQPAQYGGYDTNGYDDYGQRG